LRKRASVSLYAHITCIFGAVKMEPVTLYTKNENPQGSSYSTFEREVESHFASIGALNVSNDSQTLAILPCVVPYSSVLK
jgi:hypothetical protein